ncbi:MAG: formylglycine-generating enzyme family protein [Azoarcus sp.]|nr:formylglycine-generating enzyme family protein [Azoarcus sp.]
MPTFVKSKAAGPWQSKGQRALAPTIAFRVTEPPYELTMMRFLTMFLSLLALSGVAFSIQAADTNSIGMEFVPIPAGSFKREREIEEQLNIRRGKATTTPERTVTISKPFYLGKYEVTQEQWHAVMDNDPAKFPGRKNPVEMVSWDEVQLFISRLNQKEETNKYRLPTEAEWEYAARAGTTTKYSFGDDEGRLGRYAWYWDNSGKTTHPVGQKQPNPWGLYDMHGNVWEWVQDWYDDYPKSSVTDPRGPSGGLYRVMRGGSWNFSAPHLSSAFRGPHSPEDRSGFIGFRLAFSPSH